MANRTLVCPQKPTFQQGNDQMCNLQVRTFNDFMKVTEKSQIAISLPVVCSDRTFFFYTLFCKPCETGRRCIRNDIQPYSSYFVFALILYGYGNQNFSFCSSSSLSRFLSANIGLVNFNQPGKSITSGPYHRTSQLMQPNPRGFVTAQFKNSLNVFSTCTVFLARYPPDCTKPEHQGLSSSFKNSTGSNRTLVSTRGAPKQTRAHYPCFSVVATRATETVWPSQVKKIVSASLLCVESSLQFLQIFRIILHKEGYYILGVRQSSEYPSYFI